jgi:glutathione S-transferase/RNA polymerase-associated protein
MLKLYEHPLSSYVQKVKIALREKGIAFEAVRPDGVGRGGATGEFVVANPRAEVPALVDGGVMLFDSTIILDYIEEKWPAPALLPADPAARARLRMIEEVCDTHYEAINWGLGEITRFGRAEGALKDELVAKARAQIGGIQAWLARQLGTADWFNGSAFGRGDLSVVPYANGSARFGIAPGAASPLGRWLARVNARASVALTHEEANASVASLANVAEALEKGLFKREYRDHRLEWMIKSGGIEIVRNGLAKHNIRFSEDFT